MPKGSLYPKDYLFKRNNLNSNGISMKITISLFKADVGAIVGHHKVPDEVIKAANKEMEKLRKKKLIIDYYVFNAGDDLQLLMTHKKGEKNKKLHYEIWKIFKKITKEVSIPMKLYGAGQDLLASKFKDSLEGTGVGVAEMSFQERKTEPILVFAADKTEPGAWNIYLYKMFADPFTSAGLVLSETMQKGFEFEIVDLEKHKKIKLKAPEEEYKMLALLGTSSKYAVKHVYRRKDNEIAMSGTTTTLNGIAGKYIGKDDPSMIIRAGKGFPAVGEILEAFTFPYLVAGWMRGSHYGPLMPVPLKYSKVTRFDGPPRVVCIGFQLSNGKIEGIEDMFDDIGFDRAREIALKYADMIRKQGPFMPHRGSEEEMKYTPLKKVEDSLKKKWKKI